MLIAAHHRMFGGKRLPYDAEVEYVQTPGGGNYIDTLISVEPDTHYVISGTALATSGGENYVVGQSVLLANTACAGFYTVNTQFRLAYRTNTADLSDISQLIGVPVDFVADYAPGSQTLTFNNSTTLSASQPSINSGGGVFSVFRRGTYYARSGSRVYSLRIVRNNVLVFDGIPVRKGMVGYLYDRVSGKLFGNAGTGDFVLGPDVVPVEYIESHGTEYIDTGLKLTSSYEYEIDFNILQNTGSTQSVSSTYNIWSSSNPLFLLGLSTYFGGRLVTTGAASPASSSQVDVGWNYGQQVAMSLHGSTITYNGTNYPFTRYSGSATQANYNQPLFGALRTSASELAVMRLWHCDIWADGTTLSRKFRPVRAGTEGAMMDVLTRRIYRNAGTGAFTYGNDTSWPTA